MPYGLSAATWTPQHTSTPAFAVGGFACPRNQLLRTHSICRRALPARRKRIRCVRNSVPLSTAGSPQPEASPVSDAECVAAPLDIIALQENWVAVNKPPSMLVHRTKLYHARPGETYVVDEVRKRVGEIRGLPTVVLPVQRLDRPTSGVMVFALGDSKRASQLQNALQSEHSRKEYWAIAFGAEMPQKWENHHSLRDLTGKTRKERSASSMFEQLLRLDESDLSVVRATLATGRRHQIRRHLSYSRHAILGDTSYAKGPQNRFVREHFGVTRCCLHSRRLSFTDPENGTQINLEAPVPQDLRDVLARARECEQHHDITLDLGNLTEDTR